VRHLRDVTIRRVSCLDDLWEFRRWLGEQHEGDWLGVDLETTGLDWWRGRTRLGQVGDVDTGWVFEWDWWAGAVREAVRDVRGLKLVGHNVKFDAHWLARHDVRMDWAPLHDTQLMASLVDGGSPSALKTAAGKWVDPVAGVSQKALADGMARGGWGWDNVPLDFPPYWGYAGLDPILTCRLAVALWDKVESDYADLYDLERAVMRIIFNMEEHGARLDMPYARAKHDELRAESDRLGEWGKQKHGIALGSVQQLREALSRCGAEFTRTTDKGDPSTDGVQLALFMQQGGELGELAQNALLRRRASKTASTYFSKFLELSDGELLHPSIRQCGARTGRMSVAEPPLQALTRGAEVRDAFVAGEGHTLLLADFDQIEMRLLYHYCRDPGLREAIMSGDLHTETAKRVYQDPSIGKHDRRRQTAKHAGFAKIYGAGLDQFAATAGVDVAAAREFLASYDLAFPGVTRFMGEVQARGRERERDTGEAWVKTSDGRRQVSFPGTYYTLVNYLIQGTAADVMKRALVALDAAGLGDYLFLAVHDEACLEVPDDLLADAVHTASAVMPTDPEEFGVPLTVGVETVKRWGDKYREDAPPPLDAADTVYETASSTR
jgi:DNA polymerase-1